MFNMRHSSIVAARMAVRIDVIVNRSNISAATGTHIVPSTSCAGHLAARDTATVPAVKVEGK